MRILFLSQVLPFPLDAGPKVRSYYVLRYLAQAHQVTLAAFTRANDSPEAVRHLETFCQTVHTVPLARSRIQDALHLASSFIQRRPFLIVRDDLRAMDEKVRALLRRSTFDFVHADQLSMAHYALRVPDVKKILDQHNAVWTIMQRLAKNEPSTLKRLMLEREARQLRAYEATVCANFDRVVTVTEEDQRALTFSAHPPRAPLVTIPICIAPEEISPLAFEPTAHDVICVGGMFYPPNVDGMLWFGRDVLPRVWKESPNTRFFIVGARPDAQLRALAKNDARIIVTGYMADANPLLQHAAAFVVPLRAGGGMRVKILDAWAWGVPIVSTPIGAEGIVVRAGENILLADSAQEFARAVLTLIQDRALAQRVAARGRAWVEAEYAWQRVYRAWDTIYPTSE